MEKMILTRRVHLGNVKETFNAGSVLECDEEKELLVINGRTFTNIRDVGILKRTGMVVSYSDEALAQYSGQPVPPFPEKVQPGKKPITHMEVVQSDVDLSEEYDISKTQVSKRRVEAEQTEKEKIARDGLSVIQGDETIEEIQARQAKEGTGISSESQEQEKGKVRGMDVVLDDGYGYEGGSASAALNAGQKILSREGIEARTKTVEFTAQCRKEGAKAKEKKQNEDVSFPTSPEVAEIEATAGESVKERTKDDQIAELKVQNQKLIDQVEELMASLKRNVEESKKGTGKQQIFRIPVTDPKKAEKMNVKRGSQE